MASAKASSAPAPAEQAASRLAPSSRLLAQANQKAPNRAKQLEALLDQADELIDQEKFDQAAAKIDDAEKIDPKNKNIAKMRDTLKEKKEKAERKKTQAAFDKFIAEAEKLIAKGEFDKAALQIDEAAKVDPKNKEVAELRADLKEKKEKAELAKTKGQFDKCIADAEKLMDKGEFDKAALQLDEAAKLDPKNKEVAELRADLKEKKEKAELAKTKGQFDKCIADAGKLMDKGEFDKAALQIDEAAKLDPKSKDVAELRADLKEKKEKAELAKTKGQFDKCIADAEKAIDKGEFDKAALQLDEAAKLDPKNKEVAGLRADLKEKKEKAELAKTKGQFDKCIADAGKLMDKGEFDKAALQIDEAAKLDPKNKEVAELRADLKEKKEKAERNKSEVQYEKLMDDAKGLLKQDKFDLAIAKVDEVDKVRPKDSDAASLRKKIVDAKKEMEAETKAGQIASLLKQADKLMGDGKFDDAEKAISQAQELDAKNEDILEMKQEFRDRKEKADRQKNAAKIKDLLSRADNAAEAHNYEQAKALAEEVLALDKKNAEALDLRTELPKQEKEWNARKSENEIKDQLRQAEDLMDKEQYPQAAEKVQKALDKAPGHKGALELRAEIAQRQHEAANRNSDLTIDRKLEEAEASLSQNKFEDARQKTNEALQVDQNSRKASKLLVEITEKEAKARQKDAQTQIENELDKANKLRKQKNHEEAIKVYDALLEKHPGQKDAIAERKDALEEQKEFAAEKTQKENEVKAETLAAKAEAAYRAHNYDDAIQLSNDALAANADCSSAKKTLKRAQAERAKKPREIAKAEPVKAEPTPEKTPEATPEKTPEPTPAKTLEPVATQEATPVPTPPPTPEKTPEPTPAKTLEPAATQEATPVPTPPPTPEKTPEPTLAKTLEPAATQEATPVPPPPPTAEKILEPTATPKPTPVPTEEPTPVPTLEPTPVPTEEPTPVPTQEKTAEPTPVETAAQPPAETDAQRKDRERAEKEKRQLEEKRADLIKQGQSAEKANEFDAAVRYYQEALQLEPSNEQIKTYISLAQARKQDADNVKTQRLEMESTIKAAQELSRNREFESARRRLEEAKTKAVAPKDKALVDEEMQNVVRAEQADIVSRAENKMLEASQLLDRKEFDAAEKAYNDALVIKADLEGAKKGLDRVKDAREKDKVSAASQLRADAERKARSLLNDGRLLQNQNNLEEARSKWLEGKRTVDDYNAANPGATVFVPELDAYLKQTEEEYNKQLAERGRRKDFQQREDEARAKMLTPVTIRTERTTPLVSFLNTLRLATGIDFVVADGVDAKVDASFSDKPLNEVLDAVLIPMGLKWERDPGSDIIKITADLRTRVFPLTPEEASNTNALLENKTLQKLLYGGDGSPRIQGQEIYVDERNLVLVVTDSEKNISKIADLLQTLKKQAPPGLLVRTYTIKEEKGPEIKALLDVMLRTDSPEPFQPERKLILSRPRTDPQGHAREH